MRKIFIIIALIASIAACQQQTGRTSGDDSTASFLSAKVWICMPR